MSYINILFLLFNWCTGPAGHTTCCKYSCELTADTVYYNNGSQIHEIKYYVKDTGCLNTFRPEIPVVVIDEDCWICGDLIESYSEFDTTNNSFRISHTVIKERHSFSYLWYSNGFPKRNYSFYNEAERFKMREREYDSLHNIIKERSYYYIRDSVFDEKGVITFTGWFREK